jgi:hypothetical protein
MEPRTYAIIRKSNFDHEDWRGDQWFAARGIPSERMALIMCAVLNQDEGEHSEDYFEVVDGNYVLPAPWEP